MAFKKYAPEQRQLFPLDISDCVPKDHLARAVKEIARRFDLAAIEREYSLLGQRAFDPRMMTLLLLYGLLSGSASTRKLAQAIRENVVFMWLADGQRPDFRTLALFRKKHRAALAELLVQTVRIAQEMGLLDTRAFALDGTIVRASANIGKSADRKTIARELAALREEIEAAFDRADACDAEEDARNEPDDDHRLPAELGSKQARAARLEAALETLDEQPARQKANRTDPDAPILRRRRVPAQVGYNAQVVVDADSQVVVAADVCTAAADNAQLVPMLEQATEAVGERPAALLADAGYTGIANVEAMLQRGIEPLIAQRDPLPKASRGHQHRHEDFRHDAARDAYVCPAGKELRYQNRKTVQTKGGVYRAKRYKRDDCGDCHLARDCRRPGQRGRSLMIADVDAEYQAMKRKLRTEEGRAMYRKRKSSVEPLIGRLKQQLGLRQFLTRGLPAVRCELRLALTALNVHRICRMLQAATERTTAPAHHAT